MPAIAGVVGSAFGPPDLALQALMGALADHGVDGASSNGIGASRFGVQFHHTLPEDDFDRQPYVANGGRMLVSADARIDNRDEIAAALGIAATDLRGLSDAELLSRGWQKWGLGLTDRLLGDVALAVWDDARHQLTLLRTPLSSRPIFFSQKAASVAFATLPTALCALPSIGRAPDLDEFAKLLGGGLYQANVSSFFRGISQVPQGTAVAIKGGSLSLHRLWSPGQNVLTISVDEAGGLLRHELDRATLPSQRPRPGSKAQT